MSKKSALHYIVLQYKHISHHNGIDPMSDLRERAQPGRIYDKGLYHLVMLEPISAEEAHLLEQRASSPESPISMLIDETDIDKAIEHFNNNRNQLEAA